MFPAFQVHAQPAILRIWQEAHWQSVPLHVMQRGTYENSLNMNISLSMTGKYIDRKHRRPCNPSILARNSMSARYWCITSITWGCDVPMHEGACATGRQIPRHKPECIGTTHLDRSLLITIITWHFQFHPANVCNLHVKGAYVRRESRFTRSSHCNDGNCRLTIPVVEGRCAREVLPRAFNIGVFKYGKSNPNTIKHIYNESENLKEGCDVAFDSNNWWNLP